jgi:hypothetical protein
VLLCQGSSPDFIHSHVPMEIFLCFTKWEEIKRELLCLCKGVVLILVLDTLKLTPSGAPHLGVRTHIGTSLIQHVTSKIGGSFCLIYWLVVDVSPIWIFIFFKVMGLFDRPITPPKKKKKHSHYGHS